MFVDIKNYKSPLKVENMLTPYAKGLVVNGVRQPKEKITPQVCFEVLKSTNYPRNIKDMLSCIANLPPSEQVLFKDVVLATFDNRVQPDTIIELGRKLADDNGFSQEFSQTKFLQDGDFLLSASKLSRGLLSPRVSFKNECLENYDKFISNAVNLEFFDVTGLPEVMDFPFAQEIRFVNVDLANVKTFKYPENIKAGFVNVSNLPADFGEKNYRRLYLSHCSLPKNIHFTFNDDASIIFNDVNNLPQDLDLTKGTDVCLNYCNLSVLKNVIFKDGAIVDFSHSTHLPPNLDFSRCKRVYLEGCDLSKQKSLAFAQDCHVSLRKATSLPANLNFSKCLDVNLDECNLARQNALCQGFANGCRLSLQKATSLPTNIDFSKCSYINFSKCDFKNRNHLFFPEDSTVVLSGASNIPSNLDVSQCAEVDLNSCSLEQCENISFKKDAKVKMYSLKSFPARLDVSQCADVNLKNNEAIKLKGLKVIIFKDKQQQQMSGLEIPSDWGGKVVYSDKQLSNIKVLLDKKILDGR